MVALDLDAHRLSFLSCVALRRVRPSQAHALNTWLPANGGVGWFWRKNLAGENRSLGGGVRLKVILGLQSSPSPVDCLP